MIIQYTREDGRFEFNLYMAYKYSNDNNMGSPQSA